VIPIYAVETLDPDTLEKLPLLKTRVEWFIANRPELAENVARIEIGGMRQRRLLAIVNPERLRRILRRVFAEEEFLSAYGMRALSKFHDANPFVLNVGGATFRVDYEPAESTSGLFGGNSNWRGPIWFPLNYLLIESLQKFHFYLGDDYKVEFPTGSGEMLTLWEISQQLSRRLISLFRARPDGSRPFSAAGSAIETRRALARPSALPRILQRRHGPRARGVAPNRLDGAGGEADPASRGIRGIPRIRRWAVRSP
jgi:hypothetical protein